MITNCYTIFLVEFLFHVNGDVSKDGVHVLVLLLPVSSITLPWSKGSFRECVIREGQPKFGYFSKVEIMWKSFNFFRPHPSVDRCVMDIKCIFLFWARVTHFLLPDWPIVDFEGNQVRCKVPVYHEHLGRHRHFFSETILQSVEIRFIYSSLIIFTVRNRKYNFSTSFQN